MRRLLPLVLALSGCAHCPPVKIETVPLKGKQLTQINLPHTAVDPHLAWNGTHFAVVYLRTNGFGSGAWAEGLLLDRSGAVVTTRSFSPDVHFPSSGYEPFRLSDVVWNPRDGQFAFAVGEGANTAWIVRTDANLAVLGSTKVTFPGFAPGAAVPTPTDVSLTWNDAKREYGMAFITREDPSLHRQDDVYLVRLAADGTFRGPYPNLHAVSCTKNCRRTSIAADARGGYAIGYLELDGLGRATPRIGLVDETMPFDMGGGVHPVAVLEPIPSAAGTGLRLHRDQANGDWFVALTAPDGLRTQVLRPAPGWTLTASPMQKAAGTFEPLFSVSNFLGAADIYEYCFGDGQVRCRLAQADSLSAADWVKPPAGAPPRGKPSHVVFENELYLVWIESGNVFFGPVP